MCTVTAALVAGEGVALAGLCAYYLQTIITGHPHDVGTALFGALLGLLAAGALLALSVPLRAGRRYPRAPALLAQLIGMPVGATLLRGRTTAAGVAVLVAALVVSLLLLLQQVFPQLGQRAGQ